MQIGKKLASLYILIFFLIILLPIGGLIFGASTQQDNNEFRILAKFPSFTNTPLDKYPKVFDSFWNDNFGFRSWLVDTYSLIKLKIFKTTPIPFYDILGSKNWLFVNPIVNNDYKAFYKNIEFTQDDLDAVKSKFTKERDWLKARNIEYFIVIVPDKEDIYPEFYPYPNNRIYDIGLEQFISYFKKTDLKVVYLKDALLAAKKKTDLPLYYLTDTHWTNLGAFYGYQEIMRNISNSSSLQIPEQKDFNIELTGAEGAKLGDLIRVNPSLVDQTDIKINMSLKPGIKINKLHKIYVHGDSFSINKNGPIPEGINFFLGFSFDEVASTNYAWQLDYDEIEKTKPEIVIRESVQRNIHDWVGFSEIK